MLTGEDAQRSSESVPFQGELIPAAMSDTGVERDLNEDRYAVVESPSGLAWLVCDGMGGVAGGELAAQLAIDAIRRDSENLPPQPAEIALKTSILEANRIIVLRRQNQAFAGMGTTIVAVLFSGEEVALAHVGDSRAYLIREGAIQQLTVDHTYVQQLVDKGQIKPQDAMTHPQAHILTRCIGAEPGLEMEVQKLWLWQVPEGGTRDLLVLCTDGLYSLVGEGELATVITQNSPQSACTKLVEMAKARGGYDNISLAILPIEGQLRPEPPMGYKPKVAHGKSKKRRAAAASREMSSLKFISIIVVLSALAMLVTVLGMVFLVMND